MTKRVKTFVISWETLRKMFTPGEHLSHYRVISDAIPPDAELLNVRTSWDFPGMIELQIRSAEFPEVQDGAAIERLVPVMECASGTVEPCGEWTTVNEIRSAELLVADGGDLQ